MSNLILEQIDLMGMPLTSFRYKGVTGTLAEEDDWATIYSVESSNQGKGECQECLKLLKEKFCNKRFGCTVALNERMRHILQKLQIHEYDDEC